MMEETSWQKAYTDDATIGRRTEKNLFRTALDKIAGKSDQKDAEVIIVYQFESPEKNVKRVDIAEQNVKMEDRNFETNPDNPPKPPPRRRRTNSMSRNFKQELPEHKSQNRSETTSHNSVKLSNFSTNNNNDNKRISLEYPYDKQQSSITTCKPPLPSKLSPTPRRSKSRIKSNSCESIEKQTPHEDTSADKVANIASPDSANKVLDSNQKEPNDSGVKTSLGINTLHRTPTNITFLSQSLSLLTSLGIPLDSMVIDADQESFDKGERIENMQSKAQETIQDLSPMNTGVQPTNVVDSSRSINLIQKLGFPLYRCDAVSVTGEEEPGSVRRSVEESRTLRLLRNMGVYIENEDQVERDD